MRWRRLGFVIVGVLSVSACGDASEPGGAEPTTTSMAPVHATPTVFTPQTTPPDVGTYVWTALDGAQLAPGGDLVLTLQDDVLSVTGGCNGTGGSFRLDGDVLILDEFAQTLLGCDAPLLEQDEWVAQFLQSHPTMVINGDVITISNDAISIEFTNIEVARPDRPLEGTTWWVESVRVLPGIWTPTDAASVLFTGGMVLIDSGCNIAGTFASMPTATSLQFGPIVFTDAPCDEPTASIQQAIIDNLDNGEVTVEIHADRLRLIGGAGEIELRAGEPAPPDPIEGRVFVHDSVEGHELVAGTVLQLRFDASTVVAGAGCNTMDGPYRINGTTLVVGELSKTFIACDDDARHEQDEWFAGFLRSKPTVTVDGASLTLTGQDVTMTFVGTPIEPTAPPTAGAPPPTISVSVVPPSTGS